MNRQPTGSCPICQTVSLKLLQNSNNGMREAWYIRCSRDCGYARIEYVPMEVIPWTLNSGLPSSFQCCYWVVVSVQVLNPPQPLNQKWILSRWFGDTNSTEVTPQVSPTSQISNWMKHQISSSTLGLDSTNRQMVNEATATLVFTDPTTTHGIGILKKAKGLCLKWTSHNQETTPCGFTRLGQTTILKIIRVMLWLL